MNESGTLTLRWVRYSGTSFQWQVSRIAHAHHIESHNMVRRASTRRASSIAAATTPLRNVAEAASEDDENQADAGTVSAKAADELAEMERLEQERDARFHEAERELMTVLEADGINDHVRKRQLTRLFDRFRYEYTQISTRFRESLRMQRKIMDKCLEMKNELVLSAIKIKTAKQMQEEEMKNLLYYREECEHAWKATSVCEERERDAMRIVDELKTEIEDLHAQVKALLGMEPSSAKSTGVAGSSLSPVRSPAKRVPPAMKATTNAFTVEPEPIASLSFDEWKSMTRVWDPHSEASHPPKSPTPTRELLSSLDRSQQLTTCVSVPSLQPTAMERASTAVLSPTKRHHALHQPQPRAATSVGAKRLPSVHSPSKNRL